METKLYPSGAIKHTRESIRENFAKQLASLKADKIDMFYLHGPDRYVIFYVILHSGLGCPKDEYVNSLNGPFSYTGAHLGR
jgi:aryl-alcohol dehydrogenase-like predicted oxidoreductase